MSAYTGPVVFCADGVHYPVNEDGHADLARPLRWDNGSYRDATDGEPTHNDVYHQNHVELDLGGDAADIIDLAPHEIDIVKQFLDQLRAG